MSASKLQESGRPNVRAAVAGAEVLRISLLLDRLEIAAELEHVVVPEVFGL